MSRYIPVEERHLRQQICDIGRLMHQARYIDGTSGNISARLGPDRVLITPSGLAKGFMEPDQLIIVNMAGEKAGPGTGANRDLKPTSELPMHLECFRQRPDVNGVVHAHPPTAIALTIAGISLQRCVIPEAVVSLGLIPTAPYSTPSSQENRDAIRNLVVNHDAIMLAYHGSLTVADDVWQAYLRLESLEHTADILFKVNQLGGGPELPPEQVAKLLDQRRRAGLARPQDEALYCEHCGVCHYPGAHSTPVEPVDSTLEAHVREAVQRALSNLA